MSKRPEFKIGQTIVTLTNPDFEADRHMDICSGEIKDLMYDDDSGDFLYDIEVNGVMYTRKAIDCFTSEEDAEVAIEDTLESFIEDDTATVEEAESDLARAREVLARDQALLDEWQKVKEQRHQQA